MANTYSKLYAQLIFAVKGRQSLIPPTFREELHKYITGIVTNKRQKLMSVFAMPDHIHILAGYKPDIALSDLVRDIKNNSSTFIKKELQIDFSWQEGFGAFSYHQSMIDKVAKYILSKETHHRKQTFKMEYMAFLKKFDVEYNEKYLFDFIE